MKRKRNTADAFTLEELEQMEHDILLSQQRQQKIEKRCKAVKTKIGGCETVLLPREDKIHSKSEYVRQYQSLRTEMETISTIRYIPPKKRTQYSVYRRGQNDLF